jgi:hypothetical protein
MKCAILQPSYIPWRGYFHQIASVDVFVFYDCVQYDKHGWRNRNRIKTPQGSRWLTIPVSSKGNVAHAMPISEARIDWREPWAKKHWASIQQSYGKAPHFARYREMLESAYAKRPERLADFTIDLTKEIARTLGLATRFLRSSELDVQGQKTDRLLEILKPLGATHYVSGPSARDYLEEDKLRAAGISLEYMVYDYADYEQLHPPYDAHVSILDLLFMKGPEAAGWAFRRRA